MSVPRAGALPELFSIAVSLSSCSQNAGQVRGSRMAAGAPPRTLCRRPDRPRSPASCIAKPGGCLAALGGRTHTIPALAGSANVRRQHGKIVYRFVYKDLTEDP